MPGPVRAAPARRPGRRSAASGRGGRRRRRRVGRRLLGQCREASNPSVRAAPAVTRHIPFCRHRFPLSSSKVPVAPTVIGRLAEVQICWIPSRPMNGRATISLPSTTRSGSAARPRGDGPAMTRAPAFGSYCELWHGHSRIADRRPSSPPRSRCADRSPSRQPRRPRRAAAGLRVEHRRIQPQQQHLVETRTVAHHIAGGSIGHAMTCPAPSEGCPVQAAPVRSLPALTSRSPSFGRSCAASDCAPPLRRRARRQGRCLRRAMPAVPRCWHNGKQRRLRGRTGSASSVQTFPAPTNSLCVRYQPTSSLSRWLPVMFCGIAIALKSGCQR